MQSIIMHICQHIYEHAVMMMHDAPRFRPDLAAYLLAALLDDLPETCVLCGVVDPGVGGARAPLALRCGSRWFVGPDNGLFAPVARRSENPVWHRLTARPERLSASFHGRDLFAPAAARLARGQDPGLAPHRPSVGTDWPDDIDRAIYVDGFGNVMTGRRATAWSEATYAGLPRARTFGDVAPGEAFWYENAHGLIELAVNQGRASDRLGLAPGDDIPATVHAPFRADDGCGTSEAS